MIPKAIHFVWVGPEMPEWVARNIDAFRTLNPDYTVRIHGEESLADVYRPWYEGLTEPCERADLIRYSILEREGGWYFDTDYLPLRPIDDIVRAWRLDGRKLFIAECWESRANPGWLGNGVLACAPGWPYWARLRDVMARTDPASRLRFGPLAIRKLVEELPGEFVIAAEPWFNGVKAPWSTKFYRHWTATGNVGGLERLNPRTGGQLPFAMHLWGWKYGDQLGGAPGKSQHLGAVGDSPRSAAVLTLPGYTFGQTGSIFTALMDGLAGNGFRVEALPYDRAAT